MRSLFVAILLTVLPFGLPETAVANVGSITNIQTTVMEDDSSGTQFIYIKIPVTSLPKNSMIAYAEIQLQTELALGLHAELWPGLKEGKPWDSDKKLENRPHRSTWFISDLSKRRVRFDITRLVRAWVNGERANDGIFLRVHAIEKTEDFKMATEPEAKLIFHWFSRRLEQEGK